MGRRLRVEGNLVHGSLERRDQPCEYRFTIKGKEAELPVRFPQCIVPDTFKDVPGMDIGVTVEGKLASGGGFEATQVLAKCPSKYEMKEMKDRGATMPHQLAPLGESPGSQSLAHISRPSANVATSSSWRSCRPRRDRRCCSSRKMHPRTSARR